MIEIGNVLHVDNERPVCAKKVGMLDRFSNYEEDSVDSEITDAYSDYNVVAVNI